MYQFIWDWGISQNMRPSALKLWKPWSIWDSLVIQTRHIWVFLHSSLSLIFCLWYHITDISLKISPFLFIQYDCIMSYLGYVIESHLVFLTIISLILHLAWVICINRDLIIMTLLHSKPRSMEIKFCHRLEGFGSSTGHKNPVTLKGMTVTSL